MYQLRITASLEENPGAREVRTRVFMEEQGYKLEFDEHDADAVHLCFYDGEQGIATCRCYQKPGSPVYVLGRVAVLPDYRGQGLGSRAVSEMEQHLRGLGAREIELSSQIHAMKMYAALGYQPEGDTIYDEGQPHQMMRKILE